MDTKFWGPPGWKLLHQIAYTYPHKPNKSHKEKFKNFYNSIDKILPCKYCRISLCRYYKQLPIDPYLESKDLLTEWIYLIHNKVNGKLRKQGYLNTTNPSKSEVDIKYKNMNKCPMVGWNFIHTIAFNFPKKESEITKKKIEAYFNFFNALAEISPCKDFKRIFKIQCNKLPLSKNLTNRKVLTNWLYKIHCKLEKTLLLKNYKIYCRKYNSHRARSCKKGTCNNEIITLKSKRKTKKKTRRKI